MVIFLVNLTFSLDIYFKINGIRLKSMKKLKGLVLSGGKSSRMGRDKGKLVYYEKTQEEHLFELLSKYCNQVFISVKKDKTDQLPSIPDQYNILSPINGILSALEYDPESDWLIVPCDMPFIDNQAIEHLIKHQEGIVTCYHDDSGERPEPLFSIWKSENIQPLHDFIQSGSISPRAYIESLQITLLKPPFPHLNKNVNTMKEYLEVIGQGKG